MAEVGLFSRVPPRALARAVIRQRHIPFQASWQEEGGGQVGWGPGRAAEHSPLVGGEGGAEPGPRWASPAPRPGWRELRPDLGVCAATPSSVASFGGSFSPKHLADNRGGGGSGLRLEDWPLSSPCS